jgi:hypothetical protein
MNIYYVKGEDNTVVDALSRLPVEQQLDEEDHPVPRHDAWLNKNSVNVMLSISADESFLCDVKTGYLEAGRYLHKETDSRSHDTWCAQREWIVVCR